MFSLDVKRYTRAQTPNWIKPFCYHQLFASSVRIIAPLPPYCPFVVTLPHPRNVLHHAVVFIRQFPVLLALVVPQHDARLGTSTIIDLFPPPLHPIPSYR